MIPRQDVTPMIPFDDAAFCLKEHYQDVLKKNFIMIDDSKKELREKRALKKSFRAKMTELSKHIFDLRGNGFMIPRQDVTPMIPFDGAAFCLKQHYQDVLKENSIMIDDSKKKLREKRALKKSLRAEMAELSKQLFRSSRQRLHDPAPRRHANELLFDGRRKTINEKHLTHLCSSVLKRSCLSLQWN